MWKVNDINWCACIVTAIIAAIVVAMALLVSVALGGCCQSTARLGWGGEPNEPNSCPVTITKAEFKGKPAETVAVKMSESWAANARDAQGRENALFDAMRKAAFPLVLLFVGGLVFWGFTRSKWGWVIPVAAMGGLGLIVVFVRAAQYIVWGAVGVAFLLVIWKAIEYQKERNSATKSLLEDFLGVSKTETPKP